MDKPKLTIQKQHNPSRGFKPCYIDTDVHAKIKDLSAETNVSMARIIDKFLRYGLKHVEITDPYNGDEDV